MHIDREGHNNSVLSSIVVAAHNGEDAVVIRESYRGNS
jgi:hypothetical protein